MECLVIQWRRQNVISRCLAAWRLLSASQDDASHHDTSYYNHPIDQLPRLLQRVSCFPLPSNRYYPSAFGRSDHGSHITVLVPRSPATTFLRSQSHVTFPTVTDVYLPSGMRTCSRLMCLLGRHAHPSLSAWSYWVVCMFGLSASMKTLGLVLEGGRLGS